MQSHLNITAGDIAAYQRDGAVLLKAVLNPETLGWLEAGIEEAYHIQGRHASIVRSATGEGETLVKNYLSAHCPSLKKLLDSGIVGAIAGTVMECASAQLILDQIFYKASGHIVATPWHQDTPFLRVRGQDLARVWLTCDPSPRDLTVQVVRGSHRWNVVYNTGVAKQNKDFKAEDKGFSNEGLGDDALPPAPDVARFRESFDILSWDVEPGDALIFQGNMLHGAAGRESYDRPRRAFASLWGGPELRYHQPSGKAFPPPGGSQGAPIPHGARIGDHETAFPVGWREGGAI
jgi:ectoine hydroxylase-related dioxygenase (phytanoyl-CoA dioxygenase family)